MRGLVVVGGGVEGGNERKRRDEGQYSLSLVRSSIESMMYHTIVDRPGPYCTYLHTNTII